MFGRVLLIAALGFLTATAATASSLNESIAAFARSQKEAVELPLRFAMDARAAFAQGDFANALRLTYPLVEEWRSDSVSVASAGGGYSTVPAILQPLAEQGYAAAQDQLAILYNTGRGLTKDSTQALKLWRAAASQGYARAQYNLGSMYALGASGLSTDINNALQLFDQAATSGEPDVLLKLSDTYRLGIATSRLSGEAIRLLRLSAQAGYPPAQSRLGQMYMDGEGVPTDYVLAYMWFNLAATPTNVARWPASRDLAEGPARSASLRDDLASNLMTRDQVAEAQRLTREWKPSP